MASHAELFLSRQRQLPFYPIWNQTKVFSELQIVVELGYAIAQGGNGAIIENPVEFLAVKAMEPQTIWRPAPSANNAAFQMALEIQHPIETAGVNFS
jgi:hypothetical protein